MSSAAIVAFTTTTGLETVVAKAEEFAKHSASDNTRRGYASDWRQFTAWCDAHSVISLPATPGIIALYIADLAERLKPATIARHLAAVSKAHSSAGYGIALRDASRGCEGCMERRAPSQRNSADAKSAIVDGGSQTHGICVARVQDRPT